MTFHLLQKARMFVRSFYSTLRFYETSELVNEATNGCARIAGVSFLPSRYPYLFFLFVYLLPLPSQQLLTLPLVSLAKYSTLWP